MAEFPALPLWTDAIIGDTYHLTPAEFGAYMRLLIASWRRTNCDLPSDDVFLGRVAGDPKNWHRLKPVVLAFFTLGEDGLYRQKRLLREREYVSQRAAISSAGGRAKALKELEQAIAVSLPEACQTSAPTPTPTQVREQVLFNGKLNGSGNGLGKERMTVKDPADRIARFQKKLAEQIGSKGWLIVAAATNLDDPNHPEALERCKTAAAAMGKGWPRNWPLNHGVM